MSKLYDTNVLFLNSIVKIVPIVTILMNMLDDTLSLFFFF